MRDNTAQMSIDFLFGMIILLGAFAFIIQFATGSIIPLATTTEDVPIVANKVSEKIVSDEKWFGAGERGRLEITSGDLTDLEDTIDDTDDLNQELGVPPEYRLNVTVLYDSGRESVGPSFSGTTAGVTSVERMGYDTVSGETVTVEVRVW